MSAIAFGPWEPDKGPFALGSIDTVLNLLPLANGWGLMPQLSAFTEALGAECKGAWWFRSTDGTFVTIAASQNCLFKLNSSTLEWTPVGKLGSDTVLTGNFSADSNWTKDTGWTISGGAAHATQVANGDGLSQAQTIDATNVYKVVYTVSNYSSGGLTPKFTGGTVVAGDRVTANGTYTAYLVGATGNTALEFTADDPAVSGENDANTRIMLHMDGADASTTFKDVALGASAKTWTAAGNAQIDTADKVFGTGSALFDGAGDWISTPDHADLEPGSSDFRIRFRFKINGGDGTNMALFGKGDASITVAGHTFSVVRRSTESNQLRLSISNGTSITQLDGNVAYTTASNPGWHAVELGRAGNVAYLLVDGTLQASGALTGSVNNIGDSFFIGARLAGGTPFNGWIDEFAYDVGVGPHTANYTVETAAFRGNYVNLDLDDVSMKVVGDYNGPDSGELWTAALFGTNFYVTNINDPLQVFNIDSGTNFADATGSPPQAKYIATVGDFLFLAHLKSGATRFPRKWQHSAVNDPTDWSISGVSGDSDDQEIPDGEEIVGILAMAGSSARIIQRKARRALIFSPGSNPVFQQVDVDAPAEGSSTRGAIAPHAIVPLGGAGYMILNETGFYLNDEYTPIGAERVDKWFLATIDRSKLREVQAVADAARKIIWIRFQDGSGTYQMIGYHWQLDRWFYCNFPAQLLVSSASPGYVLDDLPEVLDAYPEPLDSSFYQGGVVTFGVFKEDGILYLFSGSSAASLVESPTIEFDQDNTAFVSAVSLKGNIDTYTVQVGAAMLPDATLSYSPAIPRHPRTGKCTARKSGRYHRVRVNISAGSGGTHLHGATVDAQRDGEA